MPIINLKSEPIRLITSGFSGCGKTNLIVNILMNDKLLGNVYDNIYIINPNFYNDGLYHGYFDIPKENVYLEYSDDVITQIIKKSIPSEKTVIVIDDCVGTEDFYQRFASKKSSPLIKLATHGRHSGISMIILTQSMKYVTPIIRQQSNVLIVFQAFSKQEQKNIYEEKGRGSFDEFKTFLEKQTERSYQFLVISTIGGELRFYNEKFSEIHMPSE